MHVNERAKRYRARQRGEDVPKISPGAPKGLKQTKEHIQKRKRFGANHHAWKGDDIIVRSGRTRAGRKFKLLPCEACGNKKSERHHVDNNTKNNDASNIRFLCRKCHMKEDGRLEKFRASGKQNWRKAQVARWPKTVL